MTAPLIERLHTEFGYPRVTSDNFDSFTAADTPVCFFFTEDPDKFPETLDVAVVLPELVRAFAGQFSAAVVDRDFERTLQQKYDFRTWPALVFIKQGQYLGCMTKIQDWSDYMQEIPKILAATPSRNPGLGIPVTVEQRTAS